MTVTAIDVDPMLMVVECGKSIEERKKLAER
jgi:hypothetical protein